MKKLLAALIWFVLALELVIAFAPKKELYFLAERYLEPLKITISGENPSDYGWLFTIAGGTIAYDKMTIAENNKISLLTTFFYNRLKIAEFNLGKDIAALLPSRVESLEATHTIFYPHVVFVRGEGEFGAFSGTINLISRKIFLTINAPAQIQQKFGQLFARFEKTAEGFVYETNF